MGTVMFFGLGIGLAGVVGVRAYFPLILMGLITRFSETLVYRPPFKVFASVPVILILVGLAIYELMSVRVYNPAETPVLFNIGFRIIGGAVIFAAIFQGFGILVGLIVGGILAMLSFLIMVRLRDGYKNLSSGRNSGEMAAGIEEATAVAATVLILLIPWISFVIWGVVIFALFKKIREQDRFGNDNRARTLRQGNNWR